MNKLVGYVICSDENLLIKICKIYCILCNKTVEDDRFILTSNKELHKKLLYKLEKFCSEFSFVYMHDSKYTIYEYKDDVLNVFTTYTVSAKELTDTINKLYEVNFSVHQIEDALENCDVQLNRRI